jgi:hypothetical protein
MIAEHAKNEFCFAVAVLSSIFGMAAEARYDPHNIDAQFKRRRF